MKNIAKAWLAPGPRPEVHRKAMAELQKNWPTLYEAIQKDLHDYLVKLYENNTH